MSKTEPKIEHRFFVQLDDGEVTLPLAVERWAIKRNDWLGAIVRVFIVPWLKELWVKLKTKQTMAEVDKQAEELVTSWDADDAWMIEPTYSEKSDPENPLGISEMRIKSPWLDNEEE